MNILRLIQRINKEFLTVAGIVIVVIVVILLFFRDDSISFENRDIIIATGERGGLNYVAGRALCSILEKEARAKSCKNQESMGSEDNINILLDEKADIALLQSDVFYTNRRNITQIGSLHTKNLIVLIRDDANITTLNDLRGIKIIIGKADSQTYKTANAVLTAIGIDDYLTIDVEKDSIENLDDQFATLCSNNTIKALFYVVDPTESEDIQTMLNTCEAISLLSLTNNTIRTVTEQHPYYKKVITTYPSEIDPIQTIGLVQVITTHSDTDEKEQDYLRNLLINNIEIIQDRDPALETITKETMIERIIENQ